MGYVIRESIGLVGLGLVLRLAVSVGNTDVFFPVINGMYPYSLKHHSAITEKQDGMASARWPGDKSTVILTAIIICITPIIQLPNKFHGHFGTPLEYVISLIC